MFSEPGGDALVVEPVFTREDGDFFPERDFVHADAAFGRVFWAEHVFCYWLAGQRVDVGLGGGTRRVAGRGLLHELRDDAVEAFLRVYEIAHLSAAHEAHGAEKLEEGVRLHLCFVGVVNASEGGFSAALLVGLSVDGPWWCT